MGKKAKDTIERRDKKRILSFSMLIEKDRIGYLICVFGGKNESHNTCNAVYHVK